MLNFSENRLAFDNCMAINLNQAKNFLLNKRLAKEKARHVLFLTASRDFEKILAMIISDYNPQKIYQWGSMLHPENFREYSDIDIAIEGLEGKEGKSRAEIFFELYNRALNLTQFPLDLLEIDKIEPVYSDIIRKKGKIVYERGK